MKNFGLWSEYVCVSAALCGLIPEGMTYEEAAAIPVNYVTAYHMLFGLGGLRKGQSVLVHMAAGQSASVVLLFICMYFYMLLVRNKWMDKFYKMNSTRNRVVRVLNYYLF